MEWITSPRVKSSKQEISATYDSFAPVYADVTVWEEETRKTVVAKAEIREGQRVLDCGCGPGTLVTEAARRVGSSGEACGVDLSDKMLEEAKKRAESAEVQDRIRLNKADLYQALPFEADSFDVVISTYVLDLIDTPDIPGVLSNLAQVLKPGGRIVLGSWTYGEGPHQPSSDLYTEVYESIKVAFACRPLHLQPHLEKLGFEDVNREYIAHVLSSREAGILFAPLAPELESHPELKQKVADMQAFAFCSEVLWGTKQ
jgi:demethylmenaquinone methyltransferase/2-methoxy-6-polyprenyl-1,4-benzoquinol methylase